MRDRKHPPLSPVSFARGPSNTVGIFCGCGFRKWIVAPADLTVPKAEWATAEFRRLGWKVAQRRIEDKCADCVDRRAANSFRVAA